MPKSVQNYLKNYLIQLFLGALAFLIWQAYITTQTPPDAPQETALALTEELSQLPASPSSVVRTATLAAELSPDIMATEAAQAQRFPVIKVVDGDTIKVRIADTVETVRVVGINTPETVDPRKPVECFGMEASAKIKELVENQTVRLETDATQSDRDRYGRLLRFVFLPDGIDVGLTLIQQGFAQEALYSSVPHKYREIYLDAQKHAKEQGRGLWNAEVCSE